MPIYEYLCLKCDRRLEVVQKFSDEPLTRCAECGGELKKLISSTSFVLKGSGWYVTDYPSPERKKAMEKETPKKDEKESKTETAKAS